jgi:hypothetical protein
VGGVERVLLEYAGRLVAGYYLQVSEGVRALSLLSGLGRFDFVAALAVGRKLGKPGSGG